MSLKNVCVPLFGGEKRVTLHASAAVVGCTFADISGDIQSGPLISAVALPSTYDSGNLQVATASAKARAIGVFCYDRAEGEPVPVIMEAGAIVPVTAGEAITAGQEIEVGASGKAIVLAAGKAVGKATTTAANGKPCFVRLY